MTVRIYVILIIGIALQSCTAVKFLAENERFYVGAKLNLSDADNAHEKKQLIRDLKTLLSPKPNETILGMRPTVWLYGAMGNPKRKGVKKFLKEKIGKSPVIYVSTLAERNVKRLTNKLFNEGYFNNKVTYSVIENEKYVGLSYEVILGKSFVIKHIELPSDSSIFSQTILSISSNSLIKVDQIYNLDLLKMERNRIADYLKNQGFYYFSADHVLFEVDSTIGNHQLELKMKMKAGLSKVVMQKYSLDTVNIFPNYTLENDSSIRMFTPILSNGKYIKDPTEKFRNDLFDPIIYLRNGSMYSLTDYSMTIKRLSELNAFKFVNVKFQNQDTTSQRLNADIFLTPWPSQSLNAEVQLATKSNNFVGPGLTVRYRNRNTWRRAEILDLAVSGGVESQIFSTGKAINSYEIGADLSILLPRLLVPFKFKNSGLNTEIPKTRIRLGDHLLQRAGYYRFNRSNVNFGYTWNENKQKYHQLDLVELNYVFLGSSTPEFDALLANNLTLKESFKDQFIIGGNYSFTYSNELTNPRRNQFYFKGNLDYSGNFIHLLTNTFGDNNSANELFGIPYSQYVRITTDLRYFLTFDDKNKLATRLITGVGLAYGNSTQLPYVKQFFAGGSNSIRAFPARGIGPGDYQSKDETSSLYIDQSGDIKLEASLEYRRHIYGIFNGAIFLDGGNVWLVNEDTERPGGILDFANFYGDVAIGTGAGIRMDFSYFVFRFDWAFPLKKPYIEASNGWVVQDIDFSSRKWRKENIILNIGIGYSF